MSIESSHSLSSDSDIVSQSSENSYLLQAPFVTFEQFVHTFVQPYCFPVEVHSLKPH